MFPNSQTSGTAYQTLLGTKYLFDGIAWQLDSTSLGSTGLQGAIGNTGAQGITGLGTTGLQGYTGAQGVTGLGTTGLQGYTGAQGVTGLGTTGLQGQTGFQGSTGLNPLIDSTGYPVFTPVTLLWNSTNEALYAGITGVGGKYIQISAGAQAQSAFGSVTGVGFTLDTTAYLTVVVGGVTKKLALVQ